MEVKKSAKSKSNTRGDDKAKGKAKKSREPKKVVQQQSSDAVQISATESKTSESQEPRKRGRPSVYTQEIGDQICALLADGWTLRQICRQENMPDERTVRRWALDPEHPFSPRYLRARELGLWRMADEMIEIADDGTNDWMVREGKDGDTYETVNHEHVTRSRLRIETRKWLLSKFLPTVFGEKGIGDEKKPGAGANQAATDSPRPADHDHLRDLGQRFASYRPVEPTSSVRH